MKRCLLLLSAVLSLGTQALFSRDHGPTCKIESETSPIVSSHFDFARLAIPLHTTIKDSKGRDVQFRANHMFINEDYVTLEDPTIDGLSILPRIESCLKKSARNFLGRRTCLEPKYQDTYDDLCQQLGFQRALGFDTRKTKPHYYYQYSSSGWYRSVYPLNGAMDFPRKVRTLYSLRCSTNPN